MLGILIMMIWEMPFAKNSRSSISLDLNLKPAIPSNFLNYGRHSSRIKGIKERRKIENNTKRSRKWSLKYNLD